jgi:general secretion pathway protein D
MKTTLPILLLVLLVSCSQTPPKKHARFAEPPAVAQTNAPLIVKAEPLAEEPKPAPDASVQLREATHAVPGSPAATPAVPTASIPALPPGAPATPPRAANPSLPAPTVNVGAAANVSGGDQVIPAGMIDFRNTPLEQVLQVYAELVNRTLLRPATLPAPQVTLKTQTALTKSEAVQALDAVLGLNGITMINVSDKFVKAVAQPQAVQEGGAADTRAASELPDFGSFITHVVQLKYAKPTEIVPAIQPFAKMNSILPIDSTQILIIRDYTENVKRMLEMIERVDVTVPADYISEVIPIKYAKASEIADALNSLSGGGGGGTSIGRSGSTGSNARSPVGSSNPMMNRSGVGGNYGSTMGGMGSTTPIGGASAGAGSSFSDRLQQIIRKASTSGDLEILGKTKMIADERSNSLLIFATRQDMDMIKTIVAKLDVVLSQVLIETVIMDVQIGNSLAYGVTAGQHPNTFRNGTNGAPSTIGGVYNNGSGGLGTLGDFFSGGLTNGFPTGNSGLSYFGRYRGDIDVAIQAAASDSRINVIQKPRILTSHATPGAIFVGNTVPYVTSTYYGGGYSGPSSSYQQLQVGIGLTVTPYINPDGLVVMQIDETIDELAGTTSITGVGDVPNTTSRKLSAEVAVRDGDTILLGGFIRNSTTKSASGVPLLKDIPILGALFSSKSDSKERKELLVMMRPTVLKTPEIAATATTQEKKRLPGISAAEAEVLDLEKAELDKEQHRQALRAKAAAKQAEKDAKKNATAP